MSIRLLIMGSNSGATVLSPATSYAFSNLKDDLFFGTAVSISKTSTIGDLKFSASFLGQYGAGTYGGFIKINSTSSTLIQTSSYNGGYGFPPTFGTTTKWGWTSTIDNSGVIFGTSDYVSNSNAGLSIITRNDGLTDPRAVVTPTATPFLTYYGYSQQVSGDAQYLIVGAIRGAGGTGGGNAYIFKSNSATPTSISSYNEQAIVQPAGLSSGDNFGTSVAISNDGTTAAIGAPDRSEGGRVYIYTRSGTTWSLQSSFSGSDTAASSKFGISVALTPDGNYCVVGSSRHNSVGAAYVFKRTGSAWSEETKVVSPNGDPGIAPEFGNSVDIDSTGNNIIVGAKGERYNNGSFNYSLQGLAYIFSGSVNKFHTRTLIPTISSGAMYFGTSVSINNSATIALVGAPYADGGVGVTNNGLVYSYKL